MNLPIPNLPSDFDLFDIKLDHVAREGDMRYTMQHHKWVKATSGMRYSILARCVTYQENGLPWNVVEPPHLGGRTWVPRGFGWVHDTHRVNYNRVDKQGRWATPIHGTGTPRGRADCFYIEYIPEPKIQTTLKNLIGENYDKTVWLVDENESVEQGSITLTSNRDVYIDGSTLLCLEEIQTRWSNSPETAYKDANKFIA